MYSDKILEQLDNLKYLGPLKGSNISVVSKPNEFGDAVKFYAQINKEDVIQKITYRASGCTHFLVFCNYFCSLVEGKTVKAALNVKAEKLENFVELDESKTHIISIILNTFALMIKRYRKGIDNGKIEPCEPLEKSVETPKTRPMTPKAFTKVVGEIIKNIELSHRDEVVNTNNSSDTLVKLMNIKNKEHSQVKEELSSKEPQQVDNKKVTNDVIKTADEPVKDKVAKPIEKKETKRVRKDKSEEISIQTKNINKDELLENLIDEGIFVDDYIANNQQNVEQPIEDKVKSEEPTKKATSKPKKSKDEAIVVPEHENTIEDLNKEITDLIDIMEADEVAPSKDNNEEVNRQEKTKASKRATPKKEIKVEVEDNKPEPKKTTSKVAKSSKVEKAQNETLAEKPNVNVKQNSNLLALKAMLNNRNTTNSETKSIEEKKKDEKVNNLSAMLSKFNNNKATENKTQKTEVKKDKSVDNDKKEDRMSSLKLSLANMQSNNKKSKPVQKTEIKKVAKVEKTAEKKEKVKKEKTKVEKTKVEKSKPVSKEDAKKNTTKTEKKSVEKKNKQTKETAPKKAKKNSYDMEYETIDYSEKKGFFSWLRRK